MGLEREGNCITTGAISSDTAISPSCRLTFIIGACAEALAMLLAVVLYFRTRNIYGRKQGNTTTAMDRTEAPLNE